MSESSAAVSKPKPPIDRAVCLCAKVRTNEFVTKMTEAGTFTIDAAREVTKANTGCGACYETVEALLEKLKAGEV